SADISRWNTLQARLAPLPARARQLATFCELHGRTPTKPSHLVELVRIRGTAEAFLQTVEEIRARMADHFSGGEEPDGDFEGEITRLERALDMDEARAREIVEPFLPR
ncbi:MAG TPA: hypothetical protein VNZ52_09885, partial [Candidatus Thermoplasmatota archaeon]|nr:hypothetical protein [Candidatus Thermoplasmatota archaeon]